MSSPNAASEVSPSKLQAGFGGNPAVNRGPLDAVGIDGIKMLEEINLAFFQEANTEVFSATEMYGVSPRLGKAIESFISARFKQYEGVKKLVVVFDGIFMPLVLEEKKLTEDLVMSAAWTLMQTHQVEVVFAPYSAHTQLGELKAAQYVQALYRFNPPRLPIDLIGWNQSEDGPKQANIHNHVPNLSFDQSSGYAQTVLTANRMSTQQHPDVQEKFIDKYSCVDAVGSNPVLFLLQFTGIVSPKLARAIAKRAVENDGVSKKDATSQHLYNFMSVLLPLRAQIVHQLIAELATHPGELNLKWDDQTHNTTPPLIELDFWQISGVTRRTNGPARLYQNAEAASEKKNHLDYLEPWAVTDVLEFESCAVGQKEDIDIFTLAPTVILRSLDLMGYFTHAQDDMDQMDSQAAAESSTCSIYGEALKHFSGTPHLADPAVVFIELVRTGAFNSLKCCAPAAASSATAASSSSGEESKEDGDSEKKEAGDDEEESKSGEEKKEAGDAETSNNNNNSSSEKEEAAEEKEPTGRPSPNRSEEEDTAIKIAMLIPTETCLDPAKCSESFDNELNKRHSQFLRAAQAQTRSLRMLVEASAGNLVLREFVIASMGTARTSPNPPITSHNDVLASLPVALPFTSPPSARSFYLLLAAIECECDAEKILSRYGTARALANLAAAASASASSSSAEGEGESEESKASETAEGDNNNNNNATSAAGSTSSASSSASSGDMFCSLKTIAKDLEGLKTFVELAGAAREELAVRDEDVGLDATMLEPLEPALNQLRKWLQMPPAPVRVVATSSNLSLEDGDQEQQQEESSGNPSGERDESA